MSDVPTPDQIKKTVYAEVARVLTEQGKPTDGMDNDAKLTSDLGLTSMLLAQIVLDLEVQTNVDPFAELVPITSIRTLGDLVGAYVKAFAGEDEDDEADDALLAAANRASKR